MADVVRLTDGEIDVSEWAAGERTRCARDYHARKTWGLAKDQAASDVLGVQGEMSFAKRFGVYYAHSTRRERFDVAGWQVRTTAWDTGKLRVHPEDVDTDRFVLVTGRAPVFTIRGFMFGGPAKNPEWWVTKTGRPAFFVPQHELRVIDWHWARAEAWKLERVVEMPR